MTQTDVDTAPRLTLGLNERRMPAIKALWPSLPGRPIKTAGPPRGVLAPWWSMNWQKATADASNATSVRPACYPARRSTPSTSLQFPCCPMLVSTPSPQEIAGLDSWIGKGDNIVLFGPPDVGKSHLSSALGLALVENGCRVFCSPARPVWSRSSNRRNATSRWRVPSPNSTSSIGWSSMASLTSQRIRPGPACCSNWSAQDMSAAQS
jgi:hypothetical protein